MSAATMKLRVNNRYAKKGGQDHDVPRVDRVVLRYPDPLKPSERNYTLDTDADKSVADIEELLKRYKDRGDAGIFTLYFYDSGGRELRTVTNMAPQSYNRLVSMKGQMSDALLGRKPVGLSEADIPAARRHPGGK